MQANAASNAADAQNKAAQQAIARQQANYQTTANNLQPYIDAGGTAVGGLANLAQGNYSALYSSPDYQFALQQGVAANDRSAASRGSLYSGGHSADITALGQGLASQQLGNYRGSLMQLANLGQGAASNLGSVGQGQAAAIGGYLTNAGNANANAAIQQGNAGASGLAQLGQAFGQYYGQSNPTATQSSYSGSLSPNQPYTGGGSMNTSWPGMSGANTNTYGTSWAGMGGGWT